MLCDERLCYDMITFHVWKNSCQWLLSYECLKNLKVSGDLIVDPLAPSQGLALRYSVMLCKVMLRYDYVPNMEGFLPVVAVTGI